MFSDFLSCPRCDRIFRSNIVFEFHLESHSTKEDFIGSTHDFIDRKASMDTEDLTDVNENYESNRSTKGHQDSIYSEELEGTKHSKVSEESKKSRECEKNTTTDEDKIPKVYDCQKLENHFNSKTSESLDGKYFTEAGNGDEKLGPNNCKLCSKSFSCKIAVSNHMSAIHDKKKPHKCESCSKSFGYSSHLAWHKKKVHEGLVSFQCKICSKSFSSKIAVSNHMSAIHDKKKPYKCESCFKTFGYLNNLSNHKCKINKIILSETL